MILHIELDAAYSVMPGSRNIIDGHYYLSYHPTNPTNHSNVNPNGTIITKCNTLGHVVGSVS